MNKRSKGSLDSVLKRLQAVEDQLAILTTMYRYAHSIDYLRQEEYLDCFTSDASKGHWWRGDVQEDMVKGRKALAKRFSVKSGPPTKWGKHVLVDPVIKVNGGKASAESYWVYLGESDGAPIMRSFGRYRDTFVNGRDGTWRMQKRIIEAEARAGYGSRLAKLVNAGQSKQ